MKLKLLGCLIISINFVHALDFSGKYLCEGYDSKDGEVKYYETFSQIKEHSYPDKELYAYNLEIDGVKGKGKYNGTAVSCGSHFSYSFTNTSTTDSNAKNDIGHGIGMKIFILKRDKNGKLVNSDIINAFYYEPNYTSDGNVTCKKV
jgi:hypothetical protein